MKIERVEDMLDDIREQGDQLTQIQDAMRQPLGYAPDVDESELEAELEVCCPLIMDERCQAPHRCSSQDSTLLHSLPALLCVHPAQGQLSAAALAVPGYSWDMARDCQRLRQASRAGYGGGGAGRTAAGASSPCRCAVATHSCPPPASGRAASSAGAARLAPAAASS